ncbi:RagB/SusD family nutrient uptake outer membrane protein [Algoriphagus aestuariicola]|uniref:RagB/SusD family nutrient uptake outer membrane protein n=1 Tax=Algoriphagus aestuariicola TaxID=1852016 RepID=A0ABS3BTK3_9BACT|nr:RagB/SusD family nutrient uptake outer membrane protein [Algoriphagus aestuariicola]MBN7802638.1 RagB/SusD family nutrient uptake outer membrane protein [Algoriphagus aestuariicola]
MRKLIKNLKAMGFAAVAALTISCEGFLDEKPSKSILVPESVAEFEAILDNYDRLSNTAPLPFLYSDDYWTTEPNWLRFSPWQQRAYAWSMEPYLLEETPQDYFNLYRRIFMANVVLEKLDEGPDWKQEDIDRLRGRALFFRASGYFELAVLFLAHPAEGTASAPKIPLKSSSRFDRVDGWLDASQAFAMILADLTTALPLLPEKTALPTQPSRFGGYALMARIYLYLGDYGKAAESAEQVLEGGFELIDYAKLNMDLAFPVSGFNSEVVLFSFMGSQSMVTSNNAAFVDSLLVRDYDATDYRSKFLFRNTAGFHSFKGNYTGTPDIFSGIALDEVLLVLAEANVRLGQVDEGLVYLDRLLGKRIADYQPMESMEGEEALETVLDHRRKSLLFRGQRWMDLKRFSVLDSKRPLLQRKINGETVGFEAQPGNFRVMVPSSEIQ